ncbi:hypothetical protein BH10BAC5_BH10BAC5_28560 [soil metagenome]
MKNFFKIFAACGILFLCNTTFAQLSGTVTVGSPGGAVPNFTGAGGLFQTVNLFGLSGNLTVLLVGNTVEDGSFSLNQYSGGYIMYVTPSSATTYTISGTGLTVPMMTINGADKIYFEGSFSGSGQYLIFQNYNSTSSSTTPCLQLQEDVRGIAVRNCVFRSNSSVLANASIVLGSTTGSLGNDSIYINNNKFEGINSERYFTAIHNSSILTLAQRNSEIAITKNTFTKFRGTSTAIISLATAGVGDSINVDSNYFYNDTAHTVACNMINFLSTTSVYNSFSFNSIGGSTANRSGAPFYNANGTTLNAIRATVSSASLSTIRGNIISNISGNDAVTTNIINGILAAGRLEIISNIIGGGANPWDTVHCSYDNGLITISGGVTDTINCYNNTISNVTYYRKKNDRLCGILINGGFRVNVFNNTVSNFAGNNAVVSTSFNMFGIRTASGTANNITNINNNTIFNFNNFSDSVVAAAYAGIEIVSTGITTTTNVYNNRIYDLRTTNTNTGVTAMTIYGIQDASTSAQVNIYNNAISMQTSSGNEASLKGIGCTALNTTVHNINYNSVYIAGNASAGATSVSYAFFRSSTGLEVLRNNIFCTNRGNQNSYAIGVQNATNWVDTTSNHNLFIALSSASIGTFNTVNTPLDFATFKINSLGDQYSLGDNTTNIVPSNLWTSIADAGLFANSFQAEDWYIFGQGTPITYPVISTDFSGLGRSTTIAVGPTTIGCSESGIPVSTPPTITNTITGTGTYNFLLAGKPMAAITINPPTSGFNFDISLRHFGGRTAPGAGAQQISTFFDSIYVSAGTPSNIMYDINLYAYPNQYYNIANSANIRIAKSSDGGAGYTPYIAGSYNAGPPPFATATGLTSFSIFTLTSTDALLPVELSSFNSSVNKNTVTLNWSTVSELNNAGFDIERKLFENSSWAKVGFIAGRGTSTVITPYKFTENISGKGKYNYRLKQIDVNGNFKYYDLASFVEVGIPKSFSLSQNYPNPFNPTTKIDFDLPLDSKVSLVLFDISGREVMTLLSGDFRESGYYTQQVNALSLSSGTYFYRLSVENGSNNFVQTKKMMLVK